MNDRALRIAVTSYYLPSESKIGAGYVAHRLANALVRRGHQVTMFSPCRRPEDATYEHRQVQMSGSLRTFRWALGVRRLDLDEFDVLHCHGDNHLRLRRGPPVVRTMHGSCFAEALHVTGLKERLRMVALGVTELIGSMIADHCVAVSRNTTRWYPWIRQVIPNGVDLDRFHPGAKEPVPTILFVGTYDRRKRGQLLMDVFESEIRPRIPDAQLWMVCSDAPDAPSVDVLGRLTDDELADRYRRAWVFCLPSTYEGFGVPYIEAMASGTAVVATPNPGATEVLKGGRYGTVVKPDDLGNAIVNALEDRETRRELEQRALDQTGHYSWSNVGKLYEDVLQRAAGEPPSPS